MNFAPTVDVYINSEAHVIGPRAFSSDPLTTAVMSQAYFFGMRSQGVLCTAKHFPGTGTPTAILTARYRLSMMNFLS